MVSFHDGFTGEPEYNRLQQTAKLAIHLAQGGLTLRTTGTLTSAIAIVAAIFLLFTGVWAFGWPQSFYDEIATYPPYNEHFTHDFGAFQIGFGVALLLALRMRDALFVALAGAGIGAALHTVAHIIDHGDGGRSSDPYLLGVVAAVMLAAAAARWNANVGDA